MKLEKREITLNEKDSLMDMLFFEENLQKKYREFADSIDRKETKCMTVRHADDLDQNIQILKELLKKTPKM